MSEPQRHQVHDAQSASLSEAHAICAIRQQTYEEA